MNLLNQHTQNNKKCYDYLFYIGLDNPVLASGKTRVRVSEPREISLKKMQLKQKFDLIVNTDEKEISYNMIYCTKGTFMMEGYFKKQEKELDENAPLTSYNEWGNNIPKKVFVQNNFLLGETEVTEEFFSAVMGNTYFGSDDESKLSSGLDTPAYGISWDQAIQFCNKLSKMKNLKPYYHFKEDGSFDRRGNYIQRMRVDIDRTSDGYRLPTIKEWEYAAKAGTNNRWSGTDDPKQIKNVAVLIKKRGQRLEAVKTKKPNEWGFFDMTGNAKEWCWDTAENNPNTRAYKGGAIDENADSLRSTTTRYILTRKPSDDSGFRIARTIL
jgi:formylglycine-generating enzyme required for sulfatase activity